MVIASLDIGSNTALLLIAEIDIGTKKIISLRNEQRLPRISRGLIPGGNISNESIARLFTVLDEYFEIIKPYKCETILLSGTNAFRTASNTMEIKSGIKKKYNAELKVLTGEEEAELAYIGTTDYGDKTDTKLVIDIGGGSTELIFGKEQIIYARSFDAGVVSLTEKFLKNNRPAKAELDAIDNYLNNIFCVLPDDISVPEYTIALAGTPATLVCIKKGLTIFNDTEIEGSLLTLKNVKFLNNQLAELSSQEILKLYAEIVTGREDLILIGSHILLYIMKLLKIDEVIVSNKGIRYGAILKYISRIN